MSGTRLVILGLWVMSAGGFFGVTGCDKGKQSGESPTAAPAGGDVGSKEPEPSTDVGKDTPALAEPLPPDIIQIKAEITRAKAQLDMTVAKLEILLAGGEDIEKPSDDAISAIKALDAETKTLKKRGDDMRERGAAYFEAWEKELAAMTTASVKKVAAASRDELTKKYADLLTAMQEARAAFDPLWKDLEAIQASIEEGLTTETVKDIAPQVKKVKDAATLLKTRVDVVHAKVDDVSTIYTRK